MARGSRQKSYQYHIWFLRGGHFYATSPPVSHYKSCIFLWAYLRWQAGIEAHWNGAWCGFIWMIFNYIRADYFRISLVSYICAQASPAGCCHIELMRLWFIERDGLIRYSDWRAQLWPTLLTFSDASSALEPRELALVYHQIMAISYKMRAKPGRFRDDAWPKGAMPSCADECQCIRAPIA